MTTPLDFEDSWEYGSTVMEEWLEAYEARMVERQRKLQLGLVMKSIPPEVKAELERMAPEAMNTVMSELGGYDADTI